MMPSGKFKCSVKALKQDQKVLTMQCIFWVPPITFCTVQLMTYALTFSTGLKIHQIERISFQTFTLFDTGK